MVVDPKPHAPEGLHSASSRAAIYAVSAGAVLAMLVAIGTAIALTHANDEARAAPTARPSASVDEVFIELEPSPSAR